MKAPITLMLSILAGLLLAAISPADSHSDDAATTGLGPAVGTEIPHDLTDVNGAGGFDALVGERGLALFFVRSVEWCPFCQRQAVDVHTNMKAFKERGLNVVFVSYDSAEKQARFAQREDFSLPLLSDTDIEIINAFGLRNEDHKEGSRVYGIPHPAVFIINPDRTIAAKLYEDDYVTNKKSYRERPAVSVILQKVDEVL